MIDESLRAFLLSRPEVASEVFGRIFPSPLPQGVELPALTYDKISDVGSTSNDGPDGLTRLRYQIDHWASTRESAVRVELATRAALNGFRGVWSGGHRVGGVFRVGSRTLFEADTRLYHVVSDYRINLFC